MSTNPDQHALCSELLWLRDERIRELEGQLRTLRAERGTVDGWDPVGGRPINPDVTRGPWNDAEPMETRIAALRAASNQAVTDGDDRRAAYVRGQVDLLSEQRLETAPPPARLDYERAKAWADAPCIGGGRAYPGGRDRLEDAGCVEDLAKLIGQIRAETIEACAQHVEAHSCVASCCDAQPGAGEARSLADCVRKLATREKSTAPECICARESHLAGLPVARVPHCLAHNAKDGT